MLFFSFQIEKPIGCHVHRPIYRLVTLHKEDNKLHVCFSPKCKGVRNTGENGTEANVTGNDGVIGLRKLSQQKLMHIAHLLR